jgi:hypothetical protein
MTRLVRRYSHGSDERSFIILGGTHTVMIVRTYPTLATVFG